jgi:hypothetical protein
MGPEILTFAASTLTGIIGRLIATKMQIKRLKLEARLASSKEQREGYKEARNANTPPRFAITRQIIALSIILSVVVYPKIVAWVSPLTTVYYCDYAVGKQYLFGLFTSAKALNCFAASGVIITPIDIQLALAVAGLYLGATVATGNH